MCLNTENNVVAVHRCHVGSVNASLVHPREVFKSAIINNAASGDKTPIFNINLLGLICNTVS